MPWYISATTKARPYEEPYVIPIKQKQDKQTYKVQCLFQSNETTLRRALSVVTPVYHSTFDGLYNFTYTKGTTVSV